MKHILTPFALAILIGFWVACAAITLWQVIKGQPLSLPSEEAES